MLRPLGELADWVEVLADWTAGWMMVSKSQVGAARLRLLVVAAVSEPALTVWNPTQRYVVLAADYPSHS